MITRLQIEKLRKKKKKNVFHLILDFSFFSSLLANNFVDQAKREQTKIFGNSKNQPKEKLK